MKEKEEADEHSFAFVVVGESKLSIGRKIFDRQIVRLF